MPPRNPIFDLMGLGYLEGKLDQINRKLDKLLEGQAIGKDMIMAEKDEIANLVQQVQANRDVVQSATMAFQGLIEQVTHLATELQSAIAAGGTDVSPDIKAAADELKTQTDALQSAIPLMAQAVKANT